MLIVVKSLTFTHIILSTYCKISCTLSRQDISCCGTIIGTTASFYAYALFMQHWQVKRIAELIERSPCNNMLRHIYSLPFNSVSSAHIYTEYVLRNGLRNFNRPTFPRFINWVFGTMYFVFSLWYKFGYIAQVLT